MPLIHGRMQDFPLTLDKFLVHAAKWHPDAKVVTARADLPSLRIGYADLHDRARAISTVLSGLGISKGDCVATLAWNTQAHVEAWYGIMGVGAVCHTLNPRLTAAQLGSMAAQSEARVLVASADLLPVALELARASSVRQILLIDGNKPQLESAGLNVVELDSLVASSTRDAAWGEFEETSPSGLCFTSGTTGAPKGVTYTHRSSFLHTLRLLQVDGMAISGKDAVLAVVPMFHANAWGLPFAVPAAGGKLVLPGRHSDGASLARLIAEEGVTIGVGVPTVWLGLAEHLEAQGGDVTSLKRIIVGGSPLAPALMERIEQSLGVSVQTSWGMTELSPLGTIAAPDDPSREAAISGRPGIGIDLLIADTDGRPLAKQRNAEGHLRVRGAAVVDHYFGDEAPAADENGWFPTGDLARIDDAGNLAITGRAKDLIKSGGEWINPAEIEAAIGSLPEVSLAAVIGRADPKWGERPILLVELNGDDDVSDDSLLAPLKGRVPPWWTPDAIVRLAAMPLAPTGKIDKILLRTQYGSA